jgi:hypothetical protein
MSEWSKRAQRAAVGGIAVLGSALSGQSHAQVPHESAPVATAFDFLEPYLRDVVQDYEAGDMLKRIQEKESILLPATARTRAIVQQILTHPKHSFYYFSISDYTTLRSLWGNDMSFDRMFARAKPLEYLQHVFIREDFKTTDAAQDTTFHVTNIIAFAQASPDIFARGGAYHDGITGFTTPLIQYIAIHGTVEQQEKIRIILRRAYSTSSFDELSGLNPIVGTFIFGATHRADIRSLFNARLQDLQGLKSAAETYSMAELNKKHMYDDVLHQELRLDIIKPLLALHAELAKGMSKYQAGEMIRMFSTMLRSRDAATKNSVVSMVLKMQNTLTPEHARVLHAIVNMLDSDDGRLPEAFFTILVNTELQNSSSLDMLNMYNDYIPDSVTQAQFFGSAKRHVDMGALKKRVTEAQPESLRDYIGVLLLLDEPTALHAIDRAFQNAEKRFGEDPFAPLKAIKSLRAGIQYKIPETIDAYLVQLTQRAEALFQDKSRMRNASQDAKIVMSIMRSPKRGPDILHLYHANVYYMHHAYGPVEFLADYRMGMGELFAPWRRYIERLEQKGIERQHNTYRLVRHLIQNHNVPPYILSKQLDEGVFEQLGQKDVTSFWKVFGVRYAKDGAQNNLQILDIQNPAHYAEMLDFLDRERFQKEAEQMLEHFDCSQFDTYATSMIAQGEIAQLVERIVEFGNQTRPQITRMLFIRLSQTHHARITTWIDSFAGSGKEMRISRADAMTGAFAEANTRAAGMNDPSLRNLRAIAEFIKPAYTSVSNTIATHIEEHALPVKVRIDESFVKSVESLQELGYLFALVSAFEDRNTSLGKIPNFVPIYGTAEAGKASVDAFKKAVLEIDILGVIQKNAGAYPPPDIIERARSMLNTIVRQEGDKMIITVAGQYLRGKDGIGDIMPLIDFAEKWSEFSGKIRSSHRDVAGIYQLVANFAFGKAAALLGNKTMTIPSDIRAQALMRVNQAGFVVDDRESNAWKFATRVVTDPAGTVGKALRKYTGAEQSKLFDVGLAPYEREMPEGVTVQYVCVNTQSCSEVAARMLILKGDPSRVKMELFSNKEGTIDRDRIERERTGRLVVTFPITFTSGPRKLTDLAAYRGEMMSWLLKTDGNDGMVFATEQGRLGIVNKQHMLISELKLLGIDTRTLEAAGKTALNITRSFEDFQLFVQLVQRERLSLQTNMLLLSDGVQTPVGSDSLDSRRLLITFADGTIGMLSSFTKDKYISTNDAVALAKLLGARHAVYCDTGMYDFAQVFDVTGTPQTIGWADNRQSTNLGVMTTREPVPQKK